MGYRSEVGVLITVPLKVNSDKLLNKIKKAWGEDFEKCFEIKQFVEDYRYLALHCDWIKWYESYGCVKRFMDFIRSWEYASGGVHYVRIGESLEDLEELIYGCPEKYIEIERYMSLPK